MYNMQEKKSGYVMDPRAGLGLLVFANIIAFTQRSMQVEVAWIATLVLWIAFCGQVNSGIKWALTFGGIILFQWYLLPAAPEFIISCFSIFANYARKMLPCLMVGSLMIGTLSLREFVAGMRLLHVPQKLIIPISVTLRYFPAIKEETGHIRDAMRLRNVRGMEKIEALIVPLMMSATETAEELSAAAVTRGIENPVKKTSLVKLRMRIPDWGILIVSIVFVIAAFQK